MKYIFYCLFLGSFSCFAQRFTYADTYPINNVDSLENWLQTHPQPTEERLKNLVQLHRTYIFTSFDRKTNHKSEIVELAQLFNNPVGKLINYKGINDLQHALAGFEALKDTSGIIHTLATMAGVNYDYTFLAKGDDYSAKEYLRRAKQLLEVRFNAHDYFVVVYYDFVYQSGKVNSDNIAILAYLKEALRLCESKPEYHYIWPFLKTNIAITHYYLQDYAASYSINKEVLASLKPNQRFQRLMYSQNLANDCEFLKRYDERLALCYDIAKQIRTFPRNAYPYQYLNLYISFKEEMDRRGRYREASLYGDSIVIMQDTIYNLERRQKLIEFQAENKQMQIKELTVQQAQIEYRNRLIMFGLFLSLVVASILGYVGWKLRQANARLGKLSEARDVFFGIVAHDLRRPMFAFQNIKALVSFHLRKQNYQAIEELSVALDESGVRLQRMLDNLVGWAMTQQGILPYQPAEVSVVERIGTIIDLYTHINVLKKVRFEVQIPEDLVVYADPNAFDLIVRNLIDNSFKLLPPEGTLWITALPKEEGVSIEFLDNAEGLTVEKLSVVRWVFEAPEKAQVGQEGMGMGLIMVARFVKSNQGTISVESQLGKGTKFSLQLPLKI